MEKGTFISSVYGGPVEEYYLGKNTWSTNSADWKQRFEVGDAIIDPAGDWDPSTAEQYIDSQIATEASTRLAQDTYLGNEINTIKKNKVYLTGTILSQSQINQTDTIYVIKDDLTLTENITVPSNCVLEFDGGSLKNGTILGQHTCIEAQPVQIFNNITFGGKFSIDYIYTEWFGAKGDGTTDDTAAFNQAIGYLRNIGGGIKLLAKTYSTGQIDLVGIRDISIFGIHSSVFPWNLNKISRIQINADCDAAIKLVESYTDHLPTANSKSVLLKDFFLDCNHKANKGISCNQFVTIDSVEVRYSKGDGIVLEASTYPVTIRDCEIYNNDGNGIYVRPEYTTCYTIKDNEVSGNHKWGINIEGGCNIFVEQNVMQGNYIGGMKIKLRDRSELFAMEYLQRLLFINNYTEHNGVLSVNDDEYEGNPALKIEGINKDGETGAGKIQGIVFIGGMYQANVGKCIDKETGQYTDEDVTSVNSIIEGTWGLISIGALGLSVDYSKNLDFGFGRHYLPSGVTIGVRGPAEDYGDLIKVVQDYSVYRHQVTFQLTVGGTNILDTTGTYGVMEGVRINNFMIANYTCSFDNTSTQALAGWLILKINGLNIGNADTMMVGDGIIQYVDDNQQSVLLPVIIRRSKQSNQWNLLNYNGVGLKSNDIGKTGKLTISIRTSRH